MKDFDNIPPTAEKITIVNQRQVEHEKQFLGSTTLHKGHTFYEIDCSSGRISEAEYKEEKILLVEEKCLLTGSVTGTTNRVVKEIDCKENCLYVGALNLKSAKKKYFKWLLDSKAEQIKSTHK